MGQQSETLMFDVFGTLVDPMSVLDTLADALGSARGQEVARVWRARQLEYSHRVTVMGTYRDFEELSRFALLDALAAVGASEPPARVEGWVALYSALAPFADTAAGLSALKDAGHRLFVFTNGTVTMARGCLGPDLSELFDDFVSADEVRAFKPAPVVYQHGAERVGRPIEQLRLVSANPFDIIGARRAGMRTSWIRRTAAPFDSIDVPPEVIAVDLPDLARRLQPTATRAHEGPR